MGVSLVRHRVLVVDDSAFMRKAISEVLSSDPALEVVDTARDGQDAYDKIQRLRPDVMTLDIEMPVLDGLGLLIKLKESSNHRPAILVCSTLTVAGSHAALKALRLGAADFITKDPQAIGAGAAETRKDIISRVKAIAPAGRVANATSPNRSASINKLPAEYRITSKLDAIVIGSSTGGPPVLEAVLSALPKNFPAPVVVAQHMPGLFTKSMSERLRELCECEVVHADSDQLLQAGTVYITQGGKHSRIHKVSSAGKLRLEISGKPESALYKPCVNELFRSAAALGTRALGIMLTGMGDDGCEGVRTMHEAGGVILAQQGETCAVYGMPRAVVEAGFASAAMEPRAIGRALATWSASGCQRAA
jgi:two-component system chemotaxis response regulator CheB